MIIIIYIYKYIFGCWVVLGPAGCCWRGVGCVRCNPRSVPCGAGRVRCMPRPTPLGAACWVLLGAAGWCWMLLDAAGCCWVLARVWGACAAIHALSQSGAGRVRCMPRPIPLGAAGWVLGAVGCCWLGCGVRALQSTLCPMWGRTRAMHATSHALGAACWVLLGAAAGWCWVLRVVLGAAGWGQDCWLGAGCCWDHCDLEVAVEEAELT